MQDPNIGEGFDEFCPVDVQLPVRGFVHIDAGDTDCTTVPTQPSPKHPRASYLDCPTVTVQQRCESSTDPRQSEVVCVLVDTCPNPVIDQSGALHSVFYNSHAEPLDEKEGEKLDTVQNTLPGFLESKRGCNDMRMTGAHGFFL